MLNPEDVDITIHILRKDNILCQVPPEVWEWIPLEKWGASKSIGSQHLNGHTNIQSKKSVKEYINLLLGPLEKD
jgi:hypothetical protein